MYLTSRNVAGWKCESVVDGRGAQPHKWTAMGVKTKRDARCKMVRSDWPTDCVCSPGVPTQSLSDAVPGDRPDTSVAANQIAPSCTAHPVSFSRLGQFIYAVMPPCQLGRVAWSAIVYGYLFPHLYVLRHFLDDFRSSRFIWHSFRFTV